MLILVTCINFNYMCITGPLERSLKCNLITLFSKKIFSPWPRIQEKLELFPGLFITNTNKVYIKRVTVSLACCQKFNNLVVTAYNVAYLKNKCLQGQRCDALYDCVHGLERKT